MPADRARITATHLRAATAIDRALKLRVDGALGTYVHLGQTRSIDVLAGRRAFEISGITNEHFPSSRDAVHRMQLDAGTEYFFDLFRGRLPAAEAGNDTVVSGGPARDDPGLVVRRTRRAATSEMAPAISPQPPAVVPAPAVAPPSPEAEIRCRIGAIGPLRMSAERCCALAGVIVL
ncbi:MAG: hypothetical protein FJX52_15300 [Alphaproteobacteria bacterium]|nr:hypothetical protein [Alphaproteobacteria bacterium]